MEQTLESQIKVVAEARFEADRLKGQLAHARQEWEKQFATPIEATKQAGERVQETEAKLRELTLQVYAETGNKAPAVGVGVREVTKLEYDVKVALDWAIEHNMALKLDTAGFEKIAKVSPPPFVTVFQEPQATIASQLGE